MNLYIDRLILEAEKGCVMSSQLRPSDEKLVIETTQQAIRVILKYDELLETIKEVEMKKKSIPDIDYTDYVSFSSLRSFRQEINLPFLAETENDQDPGEPKD